MGSTPPHWPSSPSLIILTPPMMCLLRHHMHSIAQGGLHRGNALILDSAARLGAKQSQARPNSTMHAHHTLSCLLAEASHRHSPFSDLLGSNQITRRCVSGHNHVICTSCLSLQPPDRVTSDVNLVLFSSSFSFAVV